MDVAARAAGPADVDGFVVTLTQSFLDDPVWSWAFPDRETRTRRLAVLWRYLAGGIYLPGGACAALPEHDAVTMWKAPDAPSTDAFWAEHGVDFATQMEGDLERLGALSTLLDEHHPSDPHWYLLAIGVRPEAQRRGLGSVLLAHTLATVDERGEAAYLEATSRRSRTLYERFGFEVVGELAPDGCAPMWAMWREPS